MTNSEYVKTLDTEALVFDPEEEYVQLCKELGGQLIEVEVSQNHINPMDIRVLD